VGISTLIIHATLSETEKLSVSGPLLPPLPHGRHPQPRTHGITDHGMWVGMGEPDDGPTCRLGWSCFSWLNPWLRPYVSE
jgi:hypothetical protein